jgi:hypothetical protein
MCTKLVKEGDFPNFPSFICIDIVLTFNDLLTIFEDGCSAGVRQ